ncbi:MAG: hypothetical protein NC924_00490 [Candidatus Omnitrophica bacterium]|nr:hypothetical protein [Candidatus Omnitrophota bacterium]
MKKNTLTIFTCLLFTATIPHQALCASFLSPRLSINQKNFNNTIAAPYPDRAIINPSSLPTMVDLDILEDTVFSGKTEEVYLMIQQATAANDHFLWFIPEEDDDDSFLKYQPEYNNVALSVKGQIFADKITAQIQQFADRYDFS